MKTLVRHVYLFLAHLGGFGLLGLGILDSSFLLFVPLGNDLLLIAMTVHNHKLMVYYAAMATIGSLIGCLLVDVALRREGEKGLEKTVPHKYLPNIKQFVQKRAGWALAFAALMPPPFPFTGFVAAAAALQYSRRRLLIVVACSRMARFLIEGLIAILIGSRILQWARSPVLQYTVAVLIFIAVAGSILSILTRVRQTQKTA